MDSNVGKRATTEHNTFTTTAIATGHQRDSNVTLP